jgi:hypothetical protein
MKKSKKKFLGKKAAGYPTGLAQRRAFCYFWIGG